MGDWPIFQAQVDAIDLADHPQRLRFSGEASSMSYPSICAYCGESASRQIVVQKVFRIASSGEDLTRHEIQQAAVPFCEACIGRHRQQERTLTAPQRWLASLATGLTVSGVGSSFMAVFFLPDALRALRRPGFPLPLAVVAFFALIGYSSLRGAWSDTARRRVPPQTEITRAFDFGCSDRTLFGKASFTCSIRSQSFAAALVALNAQRVLRADSGAAD